MDSSSNSYDESSLTTTTNNNNTTFVEANPSNFRAIVQHLTGSHPPATSKGGGCGGCGGGGGGDHQMTSFKLHERRQHQQGYHAIRKLNLIKLNNNYDNDNNNYYYYHNGPTCGPIRVRGGNEMAMVSPVSPLDGLGLGIGSPSPRNGSRSARVVEEEERVVIAEKGFYLHQVSPSNGALARDCKPQLLPLFPLHSPRDG